MPASIRRQWPTLRAPQFLWIALALVLGLAVLSFWNRSADAPGAPAPTGPSRRVRVEMRNYAFQPREVVVEVDDTVDWIAVEGRHGAHFDEWSLRADPDAALDAGGSASRTFRAPGTYAYYCPVHGGPGGQGMSGVVVVSAR